MSSDADPEDSSVQTRRQDGVSSDDQHLPSPLPSTQLHGPEVVHERPAVNPEEANVFSNDSTSLPEQSIPTAVELPALGQEVRSPSAVTRSSINSGSVFFLKKALDAIASSREAKKNMVMREAVAKASDSLLNVTGKGVNPNVVLEPLRLACQSRNTVLVTQALDCLGKLIAISFFDSPQQQRSQSREDSVVPVQRADEPKAPIMDRVVDTICECFEGESTDVNVQLQIIKALLSAVLDESETTMLHQASLLKAIRQIYNIFLLSKSVATQNIAQGTLEQMINAVFVRTISRNALVQATPGLPRQTRRASSNTTSPSSSAHLSAPGLAQATEKLTLDSFAQRQSYDGIPDSAGEADVSLTPEELLIKDTFLIFRSMCKLSTKSLSADTASDTRSPQVRSKLLSLHMICNILQKHITIFISPRSIIRSQAAHGGVQFMQATKQYLCHALSRNAVSHVAQVFEVSCEIFYSIATSLRGHLKKEVEVFMTEIYFPILEMKTSSYQQKLAFLSILSRLCNDPRALVELYLNYDCDSSAIENIYERILGDLTKLASIPTQNATGQQMQQESMPVSAGFVPEGSHRRTPSLSTRSRSIKQGPASESDVSTQEYHLAQLALRCILDLLKSLVAWCENGMSFAKLTGPPSSSATPERSSEDSQNHFTSVASPSEQTSYARLRVPSTTPVSSDDPTQFENFKHRKTAITDAIRLFNAKPKKGIAALLRQGLLKSTEPSVIARFLLTTEGLNKATIGEYLGEGDTENVSIMHEFVDLLEFRNKDFVDALRRFLQTFRLPGESQKIDRFMLKFADRFCQGNPEAFANADTAYVLAYSVIMLNTDAHNNNLAKSKRMTKAEFLRNNSGIDDGKDLDPVMLGNIFDEIQRNEIVLKEEQDAALIHTAPQQLVGQGFNFSTALATVGRDLQREAYVAASEEMASKSEARFRNLLEKQKRPESDEGAAVYYNASHFEHVGPMFEVVWMPLLASLSAPLQGSEDPEIIKDCLNAFRHAIRIVCLFDLDLPRSAFVRTLAWYTSLGNLQAMQLKNIAGIRAMLDVAMQEGNGLKDSWKEALTCVSQLERLQLICEGIEQDSMPDMSRIPQNRPSMETTRSRSSFQANRIPKRPNGLSTTICQEITANNFMMTVDRIFSQSATLSGTAIVHFVKALSSVSSEEILSSAYTEQPRMYSLQKVVEISYYNMKRVRFEWSSIWMVLGDHFNEAGCHANLTISIFAIDALRQLASRFLELDELPHFKFQKDFLKPFEYIFSRTPALEIKEMILQCINQMIQTRAEKIRSGWQTMFGVFTYAATETHEPCVNMAFENVKAICRDRIGVVLSQGSFPNLVSCLTVFAKNQKHPRVSLHALDSLRNTERTILGKHDTGVNVPNALEGDEQLVRHWFPILYGFHDILMTGQDMEVRSRALQYLFEALTEHGASFTAEFWDVICRRLLFPIFFVLSTDDAGPTLANSDELSIWLSTTMVEALRNMIRLFTTFFDRLEPMLEGYLDLLSSCICQENDTLARIGTTCLQQLITENAVKFESRHWARITDVFSQLFRKTTATQLFRSDHDPSVLKDDQAVRPEPTRTSSLEDHLNTGALGDSNSISDAMSLKTIGPQTGKDAVVSANRRREFKSLIIKCVLQLLLIEAVSELLLRNNAVFKAMPRHLVVQILDLLHGSWQFARRFNSNRDLRLSLWKLGFMKQLPNLLRQEVASATGYVHILLRLMANDAGDVNKNSKTESAQKFVTISRQLLSEFARLDSEAHARNVNAWRPLICQLYSAFCDLPAEMFGAHLRLFYDHAVEIIGSHVLEGGLQIALEAFFQRVGAEALFKGGASSADGAKQENL